jgi:hypothetical protein
VKLVACSELSQEIVVSALIGFTWLFSVPLVQLEPKTKPQISVAIVFNFAFKKNVYVLVFGDLGLICPCLCMDRPY